MSPHRLPWGFAACDVVQQVVHTDLASNNKSSIRNPPDGTHHIGTPSGSPSSAQRSPEKKLKRLASQDIEVYVYLNNQH